MCVWEGGWVGGWVVGGCAGWVRGCVCGWVGGLHLNDCVQRCKVAGLEIFPFLKEVETETHIEEAQMVDAV